MDSESGTADEDVTRRPVAGSVFRTMLQLSCIALDGLLTYSQAFFVLTRESSEWCGHVPIMHPVSA